MERRWERSYCPRSRRRCRRRSPRLARADRAAQRPSLASPSAGQPRCRQCRRRAREHQRVPWNSLPASQRGVAPYIWERFRAWQDAACDLAVLDRAGGALPLPASRVRRTTRFGGPDAASTHRGPVDLGRRLRQARRGGARRRCGGCGLDPCRRHGRALRAQHFDRSRRGEGAAPAHPEGARRASDDRALRSLS